jgi:hypothetical protein
MKTRLFVLLAFVFLIALAWMADIPVFAQQQGAPAPGGQPGVGFRRGGGRANTPTFAGPPTGMQALPVDLFLSKNFYKDQKL